LARQVRASPLRPPVSDGGSARSWWEAVHVFGQSVVGVATRSEDEADLEALMGLRILDRYGVTLPRRVEQQTSQV
jgi:hypothetical protein